MGSHMPAVSHWDDGEQGRLSVPSSSHVADSICESTDTPPATFMASVARGRAAGTQNMCRPGQEEALPFLACKGFYGLNMSQAAAAGGVTRLGLLVVGNVGHSAEAAVTSADTVPGC